MQRARDCVSRALPLLPRQGDSNLLLSTDLSVVAYSPTGRGLLTGRYVSYHSRDSRAISSIDKVYISQAWS